MLACLAGMSNRSYIKRQRCTFGAGVLEIGSMDPRDLGGQEAPEVVYKAM